MYVYVYMCFEIYHNILNKQIYLCLETPTKKKAIIFLFGIYKRREREHNNYFMFFS